jgi:hypothetical protein
VPKGHRGPGPGNSSLGALPPFRTPESCLENPSSTHSVASLITRIQTTEAWTVLDYLLDTYTYHLSFVCLLSPSESRHSAFSRSPSSSALRHVLANSAGVW